VKTETTTLNNKAEKLDSVFYPIIDFKDSNITNTTPLKIDVLYNGIKNFLNGKLNKNVRFPTDCITCNAVQKFDNDLLFGKRLKFSKDKVELLNRDTTLPAKNNIPRIRSDYNRWSNKNIQKQTKFKFSQGNGCIKFISHSCDDADFELIRLNYKNGFIEIKDLIGIELFEFDLDKDGIKEQYLMGMRNCTQELAIIRIRP
jgi:hypothetical protein